MGRNTYDICGKSANTQFGKTQFFRHTVSKSAFIIQGANLQTTYRKLVSVADIGKEHRTNDLKAFLCSPKPTPAAALVET